MATRRPPWSIQPWSRPSSATQLTPDDGLERQARGEPRGQPRGQQFPSFPGPWTRSSPVVHRSSACLSVRWAGSLRTLVADTDLPQAERGLLWSCQRSLVKCVCVAFVAVAGRRYTYTVCTEKTTGSSGSTRADQVIRQDPASRGTEKSTETACSPEYRFLPPAAGLQPAGTPPGAGDGRGRRTALRKGSLRRGFRGRGGSGRQVKSSAESK